MLQRGLVQNQSAQLARSDAGRRGRPGALQRDQNGLTGALLIGKALFKRRRLIAQAESYVFPDVEERCHVVRVLLGMY